MQDIKKLINIQKLNPFDAEIISPISLKVIQDSKGRAVFLNSTRAINTVAVVEFIPNGNIRGNHYHKTKRETLYVVEGKLKVFAWLPAKQEIEEIILESGHLITIEPYLGHAYKAIERTLGFEMGSTVFKPEDTVYDYRIE